jgi:predicted enzyme related to lactoylglutathione lyase
MSAPVAHFEFWSEDPDKLAAFYKQVFDWKMNFLQQMNYHFIEASEGGIAGGIMKPQEGPWPSNMSFYIRVDDIEKYKARVLEAGGKVVVERQEVPDVGTFALFADPEGRVLGIWQQ